MINDTPQSSHVYLFLDFGRGKFRFLFGEIVSEIRELREMRGFEEEEGVAS